LKQEVETRFERLLRLRLISREDLTDASAVAEASAVHIEDVLLSRGVTKHDIMRSLSEYYGCPAVEYNESLMAPYLITMRLDKERQTRALWFPLSVEGEEAEVVACRPDDPSVLSDVKITLGVKRVRFLAAIFSDLVRIIENNFDVNPGFSISGGRTPLALVRTAFAYRRSTYSYFRTMLAKGRTGLAFIRTGIACETIALLFLRVFGSGYYSVLEFPLLVAGMVMIIDGLKWYWPGRSIAKNPISHTCTEPDWGASVLEVKSASGNPVIGRAATVQGAEELRQGWDTLSPVMRRRFLASDRTDLAEERTSLAGHRTIVARARTGLAFTRTGVAFSGLGIGLFRYFPAGRWTFFDLSLIAIGVLMILEGFHWYFGARGIWLGGVKAALRRNMGESIWDFVMPLRHKQTGPKKENVCPPVRATDLPGIWATTGLALERTVLADRRNVMARLRTVMAHSRTGMAFIRTGISIFGVGAGLLFYFGIASPGWTIFNAVMLLIGLALIVDGFLWAVPAEKIRVQYPYCYGDMEITLPDYGVPARSWRKAVFSNGKD
jgi:uncharacterized membrane protein YidH (DUF202 family)